MNSIEGAKGYLRLLMKAGLRTALRIAAFVPARNDKILFFAGMRGYTCNPKYVCEYLNELYPGRFRLCWLGGNPKEVEGREYITFVKYGPLSLFTALMTSKVFVTNGTGAICPNLKKQLIVGTWHGYPYKKIGYDVGDRFSVTDIEHQSLDVMVSASAGYTDTCIRSGFRFMGRVLECGYPRNDIFFDRHRMEEASNRVRENFRLEGVVVLFAPTYRGVYQTAVKTDFRLDLNALRGCLHERYGANVNVVVRMHYFDKNAYNLPSWVVDAGGWPDMQEVMCASDILITDYSSTLWDYALTRRPCFIYAPDLRSYQEERGLYSDPSSWPGILCESTEELKRAIGNIDPVEYARCIDSYLEKDRSYERGEASQRVCEEIVRFIETGAK